MTPRSPHLSLLPLVALAATTTLALGACAGEPAPVATDPVEQVADRSRADPALPEDLALDTGLVRRWSDMPVQGPGRAVPGIPVTEICEPDPTLWPGPVLDRMAAQQTGPELLTVREAALLESEEDAVAVLAGLREAVEACPTAGDRTYRLLEVGGAQDPDTVVFGMHYRSSLGGTVWLVRRHGSLLLALAGSGEASEESLAPMAERLLEDHDEVWEQVAPQLS